MRRIEEEAQEILEALPSRFRAEAESVRALGERERWQCGDHTVELIDELGGRYSPTAVRLAVAMLYHVTDGTVRDREYVCRRISVEMRRAYPDLTYHYWRACAQSGRPREIADEILAYREAYGRLPPVNAVYSWIKRDGREVLPVWVLRMQGVLAQLEKISRDPLLPTSLRGVIERAAEELRTELLRLPL